MGTLTNAFALLADQQGEEASTIVALKTEVKKIVEEKKKAEAKKKKKSYVRDGGRGKEGHDHGPHGLKSLAGNAVDQRYNGHQHNRRSDEPVYMSYWKAMGNTGDAQANQEHEALNLHGDKYPGTVSFRTVVLSKEELREQWLDREEGRKKETAMKTLKEYEEQKAYEKQKTDKATLIVLEKPVREATHDNFYTKQKDNNIEKYWKVHKTMNVDEFLKLPTGRGQDGPSIGMGEDSGKTMNGSWAGSYSKNRATDNQIYALSDEDNNVKVKTGPALDLSETSFPVLSKATRPTKFYWEDSRKDDTH